MQLNLDSFERKISKKERINESIASGITLTGLENIPDLQEILTDILTHYELENGVFKLRDETCSSCKNCLKRKGIYHKEITLPGGVKLLLSFHQYSCAHCDTKVDRKLDDWFSRGERYSSNVKSDATRLYLNHLSSYEAVRCELAKIYSIPHLSKRTVRKWLEGIGTRASVALSSQTNFSGHFVYDEEYIKVFLGDVGKKGAKLQRVQVYLLLFRDAITRNVVIMLSDSLDKPTLMHHWKKFLDWTKKNYVPWLTLTTDGKREYNAFVNEINQEFGMGIRHAYCVFHFKKNLFEVSNKFLFGIMQTKKELPEHVKNQIKEIEKVMDMPTKEQFEGLLKIIEHQIQTFIPPLKDQIKRMRMYEKNYTLHKEFSFLRTTNSCEQWFGQTKPQKIKSEFKTKKGVLNITKAMAVKIMNPNWKEILGVPKDIEDATKLLISTLVYKCPD